MYRARLAKETAAEMGEHARRRRERAEVAVGEIAVVGGVRAVRAVYRAWLQIKRRLSGS